MGRDMKVQCRCGEVKGVIRDVSASTGTHLICLCDDCQAYARYLGDEEAILDKSGGTEIYQTSPSRLRFTHGQQQVHCVRLSPKGILRWYAKCCRTPIANTLPTSGVPFMGVVHSFFDFKDEGEKLEAIGPIRARIFGKFARGEMPKDAHVKAPIGILIRTVRLLLLARLKGEHRGTPFFNDETGKPVVEPTVLPRGEKAKLKGLT